MTKRIVHILLCLFWAFPNISAQNISKEMASTTAVKAMKKYAPKFKGTVGTIDIVSYENTQAYYVINFVPEGWILIAADDAVTPVLGYSSTGNYQTENQPENVSGWMNNYADEIVRNIHINTNTQHQAWKELDEPYTSSRAASDKINPLIKVTWNQGKPYNNYCPSDANGTAVVGCVAVAMAQAMSVVQYPERPTGSYSYVSSQYGTMYINYDNEPTYDWNAILTGANNKDHVARLLWHCGVSIDMNYSPDGSGTQTSYIVKALKRNFSYPDAVKYYSRSSYSGDWKMLIVNELQAGRAVCYSGADLKKGYGHCFNLDGYDGNNMFHVNWGWGGQNDGYFSLDGLKDATMGMDYTAQQGVIVGIRPPSDKPSDIFLSSTTVKENQPAGTFVADVTVSSEASNPEYEYSIRGTYSEILHDYISVPFIIENNQLKTTAILDADDRKEWPMDITVTNKANNVSYTKTFTITVLSTSEAETLPTKDVSLQYDKETKILTLASTNSVTYSIYSEEDELLQKGMLNNNNIQFSTEKLTTQSINIHLSNLLSTKVIRIILKK